MLCSISFPWIVAAGFALFDSCQSSSISGTHVKAQSLYRRAAIVNASAFGKCKNFGIEFGSAAGNQSAAQKLFHPVDSVTFSKAKPSEDFQVVSKFMCDALVSVCHLKKRGKESTDCKKIQKEVGSGKDPKLADQWNTAFGLPKQAGQGDKDPLGAELPPKTDAGLKKDASNKKPTSVSSTKTLDKLSEYGPKKTTGDKSQSGSTSKAQSDTISDPSKVGNENQPEKQAAAPPAEPALR